jgi:hypothetical protein
MTFTDEEAGMCSSLRIAESDGGTDALLNTVSRRKNGREILGAHVHR